MTSLWLLNLSLKCIYHFAWPVVALLYPLSASVQAIETDSYQGTRDLISYWILLSLIYLFEYAFVRLLQWFLFWPYIKLMVISWLIMPDFGRASYVYDNLIRLYVSIKPHAVMCWLNNWRKYFVKKDNFLLRAGSYIKHNGAEALEKLIDSKSTAYEPDAEVINAVRAIDNKEMQQTNGKNLQTEPIDCKDLEEIEKKEIPAGNQDIPVRSNLAPGQKNTSSATEKTEGIAGSGTTIGELPERKVQKEWSCALCQVTTSCEETWKSHLHGREHRSNLAPGHKNTFSATEKTEGIAGSGTATRELPERKVQKEWSCALCQVTTSSEETLKSHLLGRKHRSKLAPGQKNTSPTEKTKGIAGSGTDTGELPEGKVQKAWSCALCQVTASSEETLKGHLHGRKHRANCIALKAKNQPVPKEQNRDQLKVEKEVIDYTNLRCKICNVTCPGVVDMFSHLNGRKHLAKVKNLDAAPTNIVSKK